MALAHWHPRQSKFKLITEIAEMATSKEDQGEARKAGQKATIGGRGQVYPHGAGPEKGTCPQREHSMSHLWDTRGVWGPQHAAPPSTEACRDTALVGLRGPACQGISGHHTPRAC